jgi:hypothetical protein
VLRIIRLLKIVRLNPDSAVIQRALALSLRPLLVPLSFVRSRASTALRLPTLPKANTLTQGFMSALGSAHFPQPIVRRAFFGRYPSPRVLPHSALSLPPPKTHFSCLQAMLSS